ncbi:hypothetical protein GGS26DRAFT_515936 [Hypomontagnella submonticulosa]|nr:hypothetical protein GGS26DRAFT_515936 [Hypomontagnella submonticulosa]
MANPGIAISSGTLPDGHDQELISDDSRGSGVSRVSSISFDSLETPRPSDYYWHGFAGEGYALQGTQGDTSNTLLLGAAESIESSRNQAPPNPSRHQSFHLQSDGQTRLLGRPGLGSPIKPASQINSVSIWQVFSLWTFQLSALVLSCASFISIVAVAAGYSGRPLSDWTFGILSINSIIAGLTTVMKGALMVPIADSISQAKWSWFSSSASGSVGRPLRHLDRIDQVSRGAWGSLLWLMRYPFGFYFVSIGAILTILMAGIDVFSQQLVQVDSRQIVNATGTANMPWVQNVSRMDQQTWLAALYEGIFRSTIQDLPAICPTGNCTWDTVPSIGVCGKCMDITDKMPSSWMSCSGKLCNYTGTDLFGNTKLVNGPAPNSNFDNSNITSYPKLLRVPVTTVGQASNYIYDVLGMPQFSKGQAAALGTFDVIDIPLTQNDILYKNYSFGEPSITQCGFWFCMQAFSVSVTSGIQEQEMRSAGAPEAPVVDGGGIISVGSVMYFNDTPGFNMKGLNFTVQSPVSEPGVWNTVPFTTALTGTNYVHLYDSISLDEVPVLSAWPRTAKDRDPWVDRLAKSLSNSIRQENQVLARDDVYAGVAYSEQTYILITWPWIAFPAFLLLSGILLFTVNLLMLSDVDGYTWVNGQLMLLLADVDHDVKEQARGSYRSDEELAEAIGDMKMGLEGDQGGWTFKKMS